MTATASRWAVLSNFLLRPQCLNRIQPCCTKRRCHCRQNCYYHQSSSHDGERQRVVRRNTVQHRHHEPRRKEQCHHPQQQSPAQQSQRFLQDHPQHHPARRAQRHPHANLVAPLPHTRRQQSIQSQPPQQQHQHP